MVQRDSVDFILSLSGGIPACSPEYSEIYRKDGLVKFSNGLLLDTKTYDAILVSPDNTKFVRPKSLFFIENGEFKEKTFEGETLPYSMLLTQKNNLDHCFLLDASLAKSMLFQLYYLKGNGLSHFEPAFSVDDPLTNMTILVYKINW